MMITGCADCGKMVQKMKLKQINSKKAQMKIQQMAFMLIIVTLFFALIIMIVLSSWLSSLKGSAQDIREEKARRIVSAAANSPELSCGEYFGSAKVDCIDMDKMISLKQRAEKYENFWGSDIENIELIILYPKSEKKECTFGTYPQCNYINLFNKPEGIHEENYVLACRNENLAEEIYNKCSIAKLFVTYRQVEED